MSIIHNYLVDGGQDTPVPAHLNFGKFIFDGIRLVGDKVALRNISTGEQYTYTDLTQQIVDLSVRFSKLGMRRGDVVAIYCNVIEFVPLSLAVILTGATVVLYNSSLGRANVKHVLKTAPPTYLINCCEIFWNEYKDILEEENFKAIITTCNAPKSALTLQSLLEEHCDVDKFQPAEVFGQTDAAMIYFSSGTSGFRKAVQLTHLNCILHCLSDEYISFDRGFRCRPYGINYYDFKTFMFLRSGKEIIISDTCSIESTLGAIEKYKIDIVFFNPELVCQFANSNILGKYDLSSLKVIHSRSAPLQKNVIEKVISRVPSSVEVVQAYGMTECGELSSEIRVYASKGYMKHGSVGIPSRGITLKVVNTENGESLPPNVNGEICVKGAAVMKGYVGVDPSTYLDKEGFFKTGDLGYYDDDGYFYVIDRLKDVMVINTVKVFPIVLETALQLHPGVEDAGVVGIPHPTIGDAPVAFIVKKPESNVTEQQLKEYVKVEVHYPLLEVHFVSEIPRNERGKILRRQLKEMLDQPV